MCSYVELPMILSCCWFLKSIFCVNSATLKSGYGCRTAILGRGQSVSPLASVVASHIPDTVAVGRLSKAWVWKLQQIPLRHTRNAAATNLRFHYYVKRQEMRYVIAGRRQYYCILYKRKQIQQYPIWEIVLLFIKYCQSWKKTLPMGGSTNSSRNLFPYLHRSNGASGYLVWVSLWSYCQIAAFSTQISQFLTP